MKSTPINPNDYINEGVYVGSLFDFVDKNDATLLNNINLLKK